MKRGMKVVERVAIEVGRSKTWEIRFRSKEVIQYYGYTFIYVAWST